MIDRNTVVVGVSPRINAIKFGEVLLAAGSPALGELQPCYDAITVQGVDPAFALAIFKKESTFGKEGFAPANKNPGNTRTSMTGIGIQVTTTKGPFIRYPSWYEGFRDMAWRLVKPDYVYALEGRKTIEQIISKWAPPSENDTELYISQVVDSMNGWVQPEQEVTKPVSNKVLKIALSAGHHNTDGGSPVEHAITGPLCHYYAEYFRGQGHDVRVITPNDGLGDSTVGLQEVAQQVVVWAKAGWQADLYLETHTQGLGDSTVRGCFGIYPDWGSDIDLGVRNSLAARACQSIKQAVGIPIYQAGVMSEKATGVGISGFRLGIFLITAALASLTTRLIIEHGAHSNPQDLAILQDPAQQKKIAEASAQAIITYFGDTTMSTNTPTQTDVIQMNGHTLGHGMLSAWKAVDIPGQPHPYGLPISEEMDWTDPGGKQYVIQCFEREILGYDKTVTDPAYRVQGLLIGREWMANHLKSA